MAGVGVVAGALAILLALWAVTRMTRRRKSRGHWLLAIVLAIVAGFSLARIQPQVNLAGLRTAKAGSHAYVLQVTTAQTDGAALQKQARTIIAAVRREYPDATGVKVEFVAPGSTAWRAEALWAPDGNWPKAVAGAKANPSSYTTRFQLWLPGQR